VQGADDKFLQGNRQLIAGGGGKELCVTWKISAGGVKHYPLKMINMLE
jgi:hypothetical protein